MIKKSYLRIIFEFLFVLNELEFFLELRPVPGRVKLRHVPFRVIVVVGKKVN